MVLLLFTILFLFVSRILFRSCQNGVIAWKGFDILYRSHVSCVNRVDAEHSAFDRLAHLKYYWVRDSNDRLNPAAIRGINGEWKIEWARNRMWEPWICSQDFGPPHQPNIYVLIMTCQIFASKWMLNLFLQVTVKMAQNCRITCRPEKQEWFILSFVSLFYSVISKKPVLPCAAVSPEPSQWDSNLPKASNRE